MTLILLLLACAAPVNCPDAAVEAGCSAALDASEDCDTGRELPDPDDTYGACYRRAYNDCWECS